MEDKISYKIPLSQSLIQRKALSLILWRPRERTNLEKFETEGGSWVLEETISTKVQGEEASADVELQQVIHKI